MEYTSAHINASWWIKVYGQDNHGCKIDCLVGVSGLLDLIGVDLANKFVKKAFDCGESKKICKLRRGLKITFYAK